MIIVTAGHVDHGKTTLVKALTGTDTDTLAEEKRRGLTIDLGFAYTTLKGHRVGFVDVPGHHRFIRNMLAGVAAPDVVMLVVAGDEGIMPQTIEHLRIIELTGIRHGIVVVTRIDRADEETLSIVESELEELLVATSLKDAPMLRVCAPAGSGVSNVSDSLAALAAALPEGTPAGNFRLCVDRVFVQKGAGVIVTGAVHAGTVTTGAELEVPHTSAIVRVRTIHANGESADAARQGQRCAINVAGIERDDVTRGDWLTAPGCAAVNEQVDIMLRVPAGSPPLKQRTPVHVYHGAAHRTGRIALLEAPRVQPGEQALAQLRLDEGICAVHGDSIIFRNQAADITIAGGTVLDAFAPARREPREVRLMRIRANESRDAGTALSALLASGDPVPLTPFARNRNLSPDETRALFEKVQVTEPGGALAGHGVRTDHWERLQRQVVELVTEAVTQHPEVAGLTTEELKRRLTTKPPKALHDAVVGSLVRAGQIEASGEHYHPPGHTPAWPAELNEIWHAIEPILTASDPRPPTVHEIAMQTGHSDASIVRTLEFAARHDLVTKVENNRWFIPEHLERLLAAARELAAQTGGTIETTAFRDRSGLGRNLAISMLEYFDRAGYTTRIGDTRRIRS